MDIGLKIFLLGLWNVSWKLGTILTLFGVAWFFAIVQETGHLPLF